MQKQLDSEVYGQLHKQELNSSETSCDKDERCRGKFVITGIGSKNG
jgi:hypothetical protein